MRRGDIYLVDFEPAIGSEPNKRRPAVIISSDRANRTAETLGRGLLTVAAVTSNTGRIHPFQVLLPAARSGLRLESKVQAEQIRSVSLLRLHGLLGRVPRDIMREVDEALRMHLELWE